MPSYSTLAGRRRSPLIHALSVAAIISFTLANASTQTNPPITSRVIIRQPGVIYKTVSPYSLHILPGNATPEKQKAVATSFANATPLGKFTFQPPKPVYSPIVITIPINTLIAGFGYTKQLTTPPNISGRGNTPDPTTYNDFSAYESNLDALYPGAIIQFKGLQSGGGLAPLTIDRGAGTITLNGAFFQTGSHSATIPATSGALFPGAVYDAIQAKLNQMFDPNQLGIAEANFERVFSSEQISVDAKAAFSGFGANVSAHFSSADDKTSNHLLYVYHQRFFGITYEPNASPTVTPQSFFGSHVTSNDLQPPLDNDNPPLFVSSVDYGRSVWLLVSTTDSTSKLQAGIQAAYASIGVGGSLAVDVDTANMLNRTTIQVDTVGGTAPSTAPLFQAQTLLQALKAIHDYFADVNAESASSAVEPIAFTLSYLNGAQVIAGIPYSVTPYEIAPAPTSTVQSLDITFTCIADDKDGNVGVEVDVYDQNRRLLNPSKLTIVDANNQLGNNDRNPNYWKDGGSLNRFNVPLSGNPTLDMLKASTLTVKAFGHPDKWTSLVSVMANLSDNSLPVNLLQLPTETAWSGGSEGEVHSFSLDQQNRVIQ